METETNFLDELLAEAEAKEIQLCQAHMDLVIMEVAKFEKQIEDNFNTAKAEAEILHQWALKRNTVLKEKADVFRLKLEAFIREEGLKTLDLPHGTLKLHKKPDRVEITDREAFMAVASEEMVPTGPEEVKPNLSKIKSYISRTGRTPQGVTVTTGKVEFSLRIKQQEELQ